MRAGGELEQRVKPPRRIRKHERIHVYASAQRRRPRGTTLARSTESRWTRAAAARMVQTLKFKGCQNFRQRLLLSTLSGKPIRIDDIRVNDESPGVRDFEASFLRLLEKLTNGCVVEINETGAWWPWGAGGRGWHARSLPCRCWNAARAR